MVILGDRTSETLDFVRRLGKLCHLEWELPAARDALY